MGKHIAARAHKHQLRVCVYVCECVCVYPRSWAHRARAACRRRRRCPTSISPSFWNRLMFRPHHFQQEILFVRYFHFNHSTVAAIAPARIRLRIFESSEFHCGQSPWHLQTSPLQSDEASSPPMAAHRHSWAAGLVPDLSPIAVLERCSNRGRRL